MPFHLSARSLLGLLIHLFLPRSCLGCHHRIPPEQGASLVCGPCLVRLRAPPSPACPRCGHPFGTGRSGGDLCLECAPWPDFLVSARAAVVMDPPADTLVHALKYQGWKELGLIMGKRMAALRPATISPNPVAVPVPTSPGRRRARGYNQAQVLAGVVAGLWGVEMLEAMERPKGGTQVTLGPKEREENVQGAFRLKTGVGSRIRGRDVILIDDVLTTGATAVSAARILAEGGATEVHLLTFARALPYVEKGAFKAVLAR